MTAPDTTAGRNRGIQTIRSRENWRQCFLNGPDRKWRSMAPAGPMQGSTPGGRRPISILEEQFCPSAAAAMEYMNRYLPEDIRVIDAKEAPERFHSRLSAVRKTYAYYVETADRKCVFERKYVYGLGRELDIPAMEKAAGYLLGEHDFKSFCSNKRMKKSTVRRIDQIGIHADGTKVVFTYTGNGFLYNMVRILTGTLLEVGLGKRRPEEMKAVLEARNREAAGATAPPEGLFLMPGGI